MSLYYKDGMGWDNDEKQREKETTVRIELCTTGMLIVARGVGEIIMVFVEKRGEICQSMKKPHPG